MKMTDIYIKMTDKEKEEFDKLKEYEKTAVLSQFQKNPDISFKDAILKAKIADVSTTVLGPDITAGTESPDESLNKPETQKEILKRVAEWYKKYAKDLWEGVKDTFEEVFAFLDDLIARGVKWIGDKIDDIIDWTVDKADDVIKWLIGIFR